MATGPKQLQTQIAAARVAFGISQEQLANALNIDRGVLSSIETGKHPVTVAYVKLIMRTIREMAVEANPT